MTIKILNEGYSSTDKTNYASRAIGSRLWDFHGRQFIDLAMAGGSAILGHSNETIRDAVYQQLASGSLFTHPTELAHEYSEVLAEDLGELSSVAFCSTGSEATMRAIRVARAATGRTKIGIFGGSWHGSHDLLLVEEDTTATPLKPTARLKSDGSPADILNQIVFLPYNKPEAFEIIADNAKDLAMVFIEPVQGSNPRDDIGGFLKGLRRICDTHNILLGFDEIITGGRLSISGGKDYFGITPDIATYGKIFGGGLPIGLLAGKDEVMDCVRSGDPVFLGGTFSANPLSLVAGMSALKLLRSSTAIYESLAFNANKIVMQVNSFCEAEAIPARMTGCCSMFRLLFTDRKVANRRERDERELAASLQSHFYKALRHNGISIGTNRINFLSIAHNAHDIEAIATAYQDTLYTMLHDNAASSIGLATS